MKELSLSLAASLCALGLCAQESPMTVMLDGKAAQIGNDVITLKIGANGRASEMKLNGRPENILGSSGIYFDYTASKNLALSPDNVEIVRQTDDYLEILYSNTTADLHWQQGWILRKGESGVYTYVIANGTPASESVTVKEARVCTRLAPDFLDGYVDQVMQGMIPSNSEMAYAEKNTQIQDATYEMPDGSIYTKYNWAQFIDVDLFHGLMDGEVGVWNIPVSYEWLNGGPMRQELTVHATGKSPITIQMLQGEHLGGAAQAYKDGERQIFGPFFIYVNTGTDREEMIADARREALAQRQAWPYRWFENDLYPVDRGIVKGRVQVEGCAQPDSMMVVLGQPGIEIIRQGKKYMFWTATDSEGNFSIPNVRPGEYALYAYAMEGNITEELELKDVMVVADENDLGTIVWTPTVYPKLIWSIGDNNRRADTWAISHHPRAYGLWEDVPSELTFVPGQSDPLTDWYYAQCHNGTWSVDFYLDDVPSADFTLTASVAGATNKPTVEVRVNDISAGSWTFPSNDAAIYRSATQAGRHWVKSMTIPASSFKVGANRLDLSMSGISKNGGVMYDLLKLEAGIASGGGINGVFEGENEYHVYDMQGHFLGIFRSLKDSGLQSGVYFYRKGSERGKFIK